MLMQAADASACRQAPFLQPAHASRYLLIAPYRERETERTKKRERGREKERGGWRPLAKAAVAATSSSSRMAHRRSESTCDKAPDSPNPDPISCIPASDLPSCIPTDAIPTDGIATDGIPPPCPSPARPPRGACRGRGRGVCTAPAAPARPTIAGAEVAGGGGASEVAASGGASEAQACATSSTSRPSTSLASTSLASPPSSRSPPSQTSGVSTRKDVTQHVSSQRRDMRERDGT